MLNLLHVYISPKLWVKCFTVLTRDPRDPFKFVDPFDLWPADPLSHLSALLSRRTTDKQCDCRSCWRHATLDVVYATWPDAPAVVYILPKLSRRSWH